MRIDVIDLSHHNTITSGESIQKSGVIGIIHKATEGKTYVDNTLFERAKAAMDLGLKWSTYHFLRPGSMEAQMDHYLGTINPVLGERICLDHEDPGVSLTSLKRAVQYVISLRQDLQITIYSGHLIKEQLRNTRDDFLAEETSLWIAQYNPSGPTWPDETWPAYSLWQYTDKGKVPGVKGNCDCNEFNGSRDQCIEWFGPAGIPAPAPSEEIVKVSIEAPEGSQVKVFVNGKER